MQSMDIEKDLSRLLNRKNPTRHLPRIWRAVGTFAIDPPEDFLTFDVSERAFGIPRSYYRLGYVQKELARLRRFELVVRTDSGYPSDPNMRVMVHNRINPEGWAVVDTVLAELRPLTDDVIIEQPPQPPTTEP